MTVPASRPGRRTDGGTDPAPRVDGAASQRYRDALEAYLTEEVDDGARLTCRSAARCLASTTRGHLAVGQLSHIGDGYALEVGGQPLRILVVPMQTGRDEEHVTVAHRAAQVASARPASARPYPRTRHMDGTALALQVLLGLEPGVDEEVAPGVHVFDCFAMANATLCSHLVPGKGSAGQGTTTMREACRRHLRRTIALLEPTVVVAQGLEAPSESVARVLGVPWEKRSWTTARAAHGSVAVALLSHPSREWHTPSMPHFRDEVAPILRAVREAALR